MDVNIRDIINMRTLYCIMSIICIDTIELCVCSIRILKQV